MDRDRRPQCLRDKIQQIDVQEAKLKAEARQLQIERANKMLYDETDKVKSFHSSLLLSDVLQVGRE